MFIVPMVEFRWKGKVLTKESSLMSLTYTEGVTGSATYSLKVQSHWALWNNLIRDKGKTPGDLRWGQMIDGVPFWSVWHSVVANSPDFEYWPTLVYANISGTCAGITLNEQCSEKAYSKMTISDIVSEIAQRHKLEPDVTPTKGKYSFYQGAFSDTDFISNTLMKYAVSQDGRTDFQFYVKDGKKLVFKVPSLKVEKKIVFMTPDSDAITATGVKLFSKRINVPSMRSWYTKLRCIDLWEKEVIKSEAKDGKNKIPKLGKTPPEPPANPSDIYIVTSPPTEMFRRSDIDNAAESLWGRNCRSFFVVKVETLFIPNIEPGVVAHLKMAAVNGVEHPLTGKYLITQVTHKIRTERFYSVLWLERRETN